MDNTTVTLLEKNEKKSNQLSDIEDADVSDTGASLSSSEIRGEDFTKETLLANLVLESPMDTDSSALQQMQLTKQDYCISRIAIWRELQW